jgi:two-component system nitrate/nitrite response regulator NarL
MPIATALVGPNALLREGLASILAKAGFRVLASASCADDLGLSAGSKPQTSLLIIDVVGDLQAAVRQIELYKSCCPGGRVAVLGDPHHPSDIVCIFRAGANAYLTQKVPCDVLIKYLELVMLGETILPASIVIERAENAAKEGDDGNEGDEPASALALPDPLVNAVRDHNVPPLSERERRVVDHIRLGQSNKSIAYKMAITEATVKIHVKQILRKTRMQNRTQVAIWAMNNGLSAAVTNGVQPPPPLLPAAAPASEILARGQE